MSSLMAMSFLCSLGPVWYHPTILSLAGKEKIGGFEVLYEDLSKSLKQHKNSSCYVLYFFQNSRQKKSSKTKPETSTSQTSLGDQAYMITRK